MKGRVRWTHSLDEGWAPQGEDGAEGTRQAPSISNSRSRHKTWLWPRADTPPHPPGESPPGSTTYSPLHLLAAPWPGPLLSSLLSLTPSHPPPSVSLTRLSLLPLAPSCLIHQDYLNVPSPKKPALTPQFELGALCSPYTAVDFVNSGSLRPRRPLVWQASQLQPAPSQGRTTERLHSSAVVSEKKRAPGSALPTWPSTWPSLAWGNPALPMWSGALADWSNEPGGSGSPWDSAWQR